MSVRGRDAPSPQTPRGRGRGRGRSGYDHDKKSDGGYNSGGRGGGRGQGGYDNKDSNNGDYSGGGRGRGRGRGRGNGRFESDSPRDVSRYRDRASPSRSPSPGPGPGRDRGRGRGPGRRPYKSIASTRHSAYTPRTLGAYGIEEKWAEGMDKKNQNQNGNQSTQRKLYVTAKLDRLHIDRQQMPAIVEWMQSQFIPYLTSLSLPSSHLLVSFELQDNDIDSEALSVLISYLTQVVTQKIFTIEALKLWSNSINDAGAFTLATFLTHDHSHGSPLTELHLSHNTLTAKGALALLRAVYGYMYPPSPSTSTSTSTSRSIRLWPLWLRLEWNQIDVAELMRHTTRVKTTAQRDAQVAKALRKKEKRRIRRQQLAQEAAAAATASVSSPESEAASATSPPLSGYESEDRGHIDESESDQEEEDEKDGEDEDDDEDEDEDDMVEDVQKLSLEEEDQDGQDQPITSTNVISTTHTATATATATVTSTSTSTTSISPLIPICAVDSRVLCSVRRCRYGIGSAVAHVCFITLQHTPYQQSDLLQALQQKGGKMNVASVKSTISSPIVASISPPMGMSMPMSSPTLSSTSTFTSTSTSTTTSAPPRPLVLFLDTNSVFNMIATRKVCRYWTWNYLYERACKGMFGSGWEDSRRHVYIALSSAVLNEMDAHKEARRKLQNVARQNYQTQLAYDIRAQFGLRASDPSSSFLAKCKNLGGPDRGFIKTLSVADSEMHVSMRSNANDDRRTQNDRKILNAALHWNQTIGTNGIVIFITDDANLAEIARSSLPTLSVVSLDRAMANYVDEVWDSVLLRRVLTQVGCTLTETPSQRYDVNVYEALRSAISILQSTLSHPQHQLNNPEEVQRQIDAWNGILSNAPSLLVSLRSTGTPNKAITSASTSTSPSPSPSPSPSIPTSSFAQ